MRGTAWLRDCLPQLLGTGFSALFGGIFLAVLGLPASAVSFLCLVIGLGGILPLGVDRVRRMRFYRETQEALDALEEKYLLSELVEEPGFAEGDFLCQVLTQVNKSMADRVGAAQRDMKEYREYIETWVHEIKTPIAAAQLILENTSDALAGRLEGELFRIERCTEQALYYARSGSVAQDYLIRAVSLHEVVGDAVKKYARPLIAAGFHVARRDLTATVYTDEKWAGFILGQLIANAIEYRRADPALTFSQREGEHAITLCILDNGAGISAADLPRVFDKGFTGAHGRSGTGRATGLGLYLCKKLCRQLALEIQIFAKEGAWTRVELTFPKSRFHFAQ